MSRSMLWSTLVFVVFAFATIMIFFWVREGTLEGAGAAMDRTLSSAGSEVSNAATTVVNATEEAVDKVANGDDQT